jgi:hypothetical protein
MITSTQLKEQGIELTDFFDSIIEKRQLQQLDEAFMDITELSKLQRKRLIEYIDEVEESGMYGDVQAALKSVRSLTFKLL